MFKSWTINTWFKYQPSDSKICFFPPYFASQTILQETSAMYVFQPIKFTWVLYMVSFKAPFISRNSASFLKSLFFSSLLCSVQTELVWESSSF
uniref:Uncharacterized protein n=1 Tax=Theropithecus gelada TaxID=9565 RepID=A0A8D2ED06_THEGE